MAPAGDTHVVGGGGGGGNWLQGIMQVLLEFSI